MQISTNLFATDCCQTTTDQKLIYFPTNSCKLHRHLGSLKIWSLNSALLEKIHALLQDVVSSFGVMLIFGLFSLLFCIV